MGQGVEWRKIIVVDKNRMMEMKGIAHWLVVHAEQCAKFMRNPSSMFAGIDGGKCSLNDQELRCKYTNMPFA